MSSENIETIRQMSFLITLTAISYAAYASNNRKVLIENMFFQLLAFATFSVMMHLTTDVQSARIILVLHAMFAVYNLNL